MRCACVLLARFAGGAGAEERWALVLSGASGGAKYAEQMREWRNGARAPRWSTATGSPPTRCGSSSTRPSRPASRGPPQNVRTAIGGCAQAAHARRRAAHRPARPWHVRRRRREVQSGRSRSDRCGVEHAAQRPSRPPGRRQHDRSELPVPRALVRRQSHRHHRDRFRGAEIRHGVSRVFRRRRWAKRRAISTRTGGRRFSRCSPPPAGGQAALRAARAADDRAGGLRRQRRRRRPRS